MKNLILIILLLSNYISLSQIEKAPDRFRGEGPFDQLIIRGATLINGNGAPPTGPVDIVIEEKLVGEEFSMFTLSDGSSCSHLPPVQDYKRALDKNKGPNTGGMGSVLDDFEFLNNENYTRNLNILDYLINYINFAKIVYFYVRHKIYNHYYFLNQ